MSVGAADAEAFLAASQDALRAASRADPLATLGWWSLLDDLGDPEARAALFSLFRAEGRELADTGALGGLLAAPYLGAVTTSGAAPRLDSVAATIPRQSPRRGPVDVLVGPPTVDQLLVDDPDSGVMLVPAAAATFVPVDVAGRLTLHEVEFDPSAATHLLEHDAAAAARVRSRFLGRVAVGFELLGAAEAAVAVAVGHATAREQFGRPIATFQAVRHLLAWAVTDCTAIEAVATEACALDGDAPAHYDEVVKALAGRNARRACQRSLQVLGAIGFTAEHEHHHYYSRVLALDALVGTSTELTWSLGARLRTAR